MSLTPNKCTIIFSNKNKQKNFSPNNEKKEERDIFPLRRDNDSPLSSHQEPSKNEKSFSYKNGD